MKKKRDRTQEQLDRLRQIRGSSGDAIEALRDGLASPSNHVAAKAASIAEREGMDALTPALLEAFDRFLADAPRLDKGCAAVSAIVRALYAFDHQEPGPYRRGIRHHQWEGFGPVDVATELRGACALGLAQTRDPHALEDLAALLADAEAPARLSAARALGCRGEPAALPALLLKIHMGDAEMEVLAECLAALLAIDCCERTVAMAAEQLDSGDPDRARAAAIALGSARDDRAFDALRAKWDATSGGPLRQPLLDAMSVSRNEKAVEFLYRLAAGEPLPTASMAVRALAIHRRDSRMAALSETLAERRPDLADVIRVAFNRGTLEAD